MKVASSTPTTVVGPGIVLAGLLNKVQKAITKEDHLLRQFWEWEVEGSEFEEDHKKGVITAICLIFSIPKKEPAVNKLLEFLAEALINPSFYVDKAKLGNEMNGDSNNKMEEEDMEEVGSDLRVLAEHVINFLQETCSSSNKMVRSRSFQLLFLLLEKCVRYRIVSSKFDDMVNHLKASLYDKNPVVRSHAVKMLTILVEEDHWIVEGDEMNERILFLMGHDTNPSVRRDIVKYIFLRGPFLNKCIERTRDTNDLVRCTAYESLGDRVLVTTIPPDRLPFVLREGLNDRSSIVQTACKTMLVHRWLPQLQNNPIYLLNLLLLQVSDEPLNNINLNTAKEVENVAVMAIISILEVFKRVRLPFSGGIIDTTELCVSSSLLWRVMCEYYTSHQNDSSFAKRNHEKYLPNVMYLCDICCSYMDDLIATKQSGDNLEQKLPTRIFIIRQLLLVASIVDLIEETGRRRLFQILTLSLLDDETFVSFELDLIGPIMSLLCKEYTDLLNEVLEKINSSYSPGNANDDILIQKNLYVIYYYLHHNPNFQSSQHLRDHDLFRLLFERYVTPNIKSPVPLTRALVIKCLSPLCVSEIEFAKPVFPTIMSNLKYMTKHESLFIITESLHCFFDSILHFGFELLGIHANIDLQATDINAYENTLSLILSKFGQAHEDIQFLIFEGLSKLFLLRRLSCDKILSSMIKLYFNKDSGDSIKQLLNVFLPTFSFSRLDNQLFITQIVIDIVTQLLICSKTESRADNLEEIIRYSIFLTNPNNVNQSMKQQQESHEITSRLDVNPHYIMYNAICEFMSNTLDMLSTQDLRMVSKCLLDLSLLELTSDQLSLLPIRLITDPPSLKLLALFTSRYHPREQT